MNVGNDGMSIHDIMTDARNDHMCVYRKFGLEAAISNGRTQATKRMLKT